MKHTHKNAFTLIELLVVISIIALLIGILLPSLASARVAARQVKSKTQLRGYQQGCFTFAQENNGFYPGVLTSGPFSGLVMGQGVVRNTYTSLNPEGGNVGRGRDNWVRFGILVDQNFMPSEYMVSPGETDPDVVVWDQAVNISQKNASYAMLRIGNTGVNTDPLRISWRDEPDAGLPIASARNRSTDASNPESVWAEAGSGEWEGGVVWNDNHVSYETDAVVDRTLVDKQRNVDDHLFTNTEETDTDRQARNIRMNPTNE